MGDMEKRVWGYIRANPFLALGGVFLLLLVGLVWFKLPHWLLSSSKDLFEPADLLKLENDVRTGLTQAVGAIVLFVGLPLTWLGIRAQKETLTHQLRMAALDKRLEVHQQTFVLWWKLIGDLEKEEKEVRERALEWQEWWVNNCVYLNVEEPAFSMAGDNAFAYSSSMNAARDLEKLGYIEEAQKMREKALEKRRSVVEVGSLILKAVELPRLGENEYLRIKAGNGKDAAKAGRNN